MDKVVGQVQTRLVGALGSVTASAADDGGGARFTTVASFWGGMTWRKKPDEFPCNDGQPMSNDQPVRRVGRFWISLHWLMAGTVLMILTVALVHPLLSPDRYPRDYSLERHWTFLVPPDRHPDFVAAVDKVARSHGLSPHGRRSLPETEDDEIIFFRYQRLDGTVLLIANNRLKLREFVVGVSDTKKTKQWQALGDDIEAALSPFERTLPTWGSPLSRLR